MATFSKIKLSGSTNGKGIKIAATATPGTLIHTAVTGVSDLDEIWIYCYNGHTAVVNITLEWGGVSVPDDNIKLGILPQQGLFLAVPGLLLQNDLVIRAFASVANVLVITGFVNRITA